MKLIGNINRLLDDESKAFIGPGKAWIAASCFLIKDELERVDWHEVPLLININGVSVVQNELNTVCIKCRTIPEVIEHANDLESGYLCQTEGTA